MKNTLTEIEDLKQNVLTILNEEKSSFVKSDSLIELVNGELQRKLDFDSYIMDIEKKNICVDFLYMGHDLWLSFVKEFWIKVNEVLQYYVSVDNSKVFEIVYEVADKSLTLEKYILIIDNFMNRKGFSIVLQKPNGDNDNKKNSNGVYFNLRGFWYDDKGRKVKNINEHVNFIVHQDSDSNNESYIYNDEKVQGKIFDRFTNTVNKLLNRFEYRIYIRPDVKFESVCYTNYNNKDVVITTDIDLNFLFSFIVFSKQIEKFKG